MQYRSLGSTGIQVSAIAFGAGPVPELMTETARAKQLDVVRRALDAGINWFDTAATYGTGQSERSLGAALQDLGARDRVHVATKVRLMPKDLESIRDNVVASANDSLKRLGLSRVTLLQLHNSITARRGDEPTSVTPNDVLRPDGVLDAFQQLKQDGLVQHFGLTGIGQPDALREVVGTGQFATMQVPFSLLNPSAGHSVPQDFIEANYGTIISACSVHKMGVFAIRVFAGGVLAGQQPSQHTYKTKFFPLALFHRDQQRVEQLQQRLGSLGDVKELAIRFVLSQPDVSSAIIGFGDTSHVDDAIRYLDGGPLSDDLLETLLRFEYLAIGTDAANSDSPDNKKLPRLDRDN